MKLPTIAIPPNSVPLRPIVTCIGLVLLTYAVTVSVISLRPNGFALRPSARKFLGLKRQTPKVCSQLARRDSVNWNYFYYYKNPATQEDIIWCKVPKAGSTTLTKLFLRLAGSKNYNNNTRIHKMLRDFYPRLPNQIMWDKMRTTKTFMVARDPFERILSAYRDKLENYKRDLLYRDGYYYEHYGRFMVKQNPPMKAKNGTRIRTKRNSNSTKETFLNSTSPVSPSPRKEPTWKEFVSYLLKTSVSRYDEHWMPITKLCSPCSVQFDYVIKMENFDAEIQNPLKNAGITAIELGRNHITGTSNKKLVEKYFKNLTLNEVKKLYTKYKKDFLLFGYTPFKYFRLFKKGKSMSMN